jgi:hypothetical protein
MNNRYHVLPWEGSWCVADRENLSDEGVKFSTRREAREEARRLNRVTEEFSNMPVGGSYDH